MKTKILMTGVLSLILALGISAQSGFEIAPDNFNEMYLNQNLSNNFEDFPMVSQMENTSEDTLLLRWTKMVSSDCTPGWKILISDHNLDYLPEVLTSPFPMTLLPEQSEIFFVVHAMPRMNPGCCQIDVIFSEYDNPDIVLDSASYFISVNDSSCSLSSTHNPENSTATIFPNPVFDRLQILSENAYDRLLIFDNAGRQIQTFENDFQEFFEVSNLVNGHYTIILTQSGRVVGRQKMVKVSK